LKVVKQKLNGPVNKQLTITLVIDHSKLSMPHKESGHDMHHMRHGQDAAKPQGPKPRAIEWTDEMAAMNSKSDNTNLVWKLIDAKTKAENMHIKWQFKRGDFVKIRIYNDPKSVHPMQHPIHFHGQRFVIASLNGQANFNLVWKDSALIAPGETMDIVLEAANPGQWMAHCHIAEHLHAGMMLSFNVSE
jgi:FtsP/CotA-like multicopper oxidase with cupredoxin domain